MELDSPDGLSEEPQTNRRSLLRYAALTGLIAGVAGCSSDESEVTSGPVSDEPDPSSTEEPTPTATPEPSVAERVMRRYDNRFDSFVDVTEAGADPDGDAPIDDVLRDAVADDTLLYFPGGTYRIETVKLADAHNFGLVGSREETVIFKPAVDAQAIDNHFLRFLYMSDLLVEGIELDFTASGHGGLVQVLAEGDFAVRDVRTRGAVPKDAIGWMFEVVDDNSAGTVENLALPDGGHPDGNSVGLYVGRSHAGEIRFESCHVADFPNNGLYASTPGADDGGGGQVHVRGGRYANNNIANVRIGGDGSAVRDVTIVMDEVPPYDPTTLNARGIRIRRGRDHVVENCEIRIGPDGGDGYGAIVHHAGAGPTTVRDTDVVVDRDEAYAVNVFSAPGVSGGPTFRNVRITGEASGGAAVFVQNRGGIEFRECVVDQSGTDRNGFIFRNTSDCFVADTTIKVDGVPIVETDADIETKNLNVAGLGGDETDISDGVHSGEHSLLETSRSDTDR